MISGCFDHSAIWSRTKMWRRNRSSVVCASAIRSGRLGIVPSRAVADGRHRIQEGDAREILDLDPLLQRVLSSRARPVGDRRPIRKAPDTVAVIDEGLN